MAKTTETMRIDEAPLFSRGIVSDAEKIGFARSGETRTLAEWGSNFSRAVRARAYKVDFCRETDEKTVAFVQDPCGLVVDLAADAQNGGAEV